MALSFERVRSAFEFFGLELYSSPEKTKKTYKSYMRTHHPDVNPSGHEACSAANEHFRVLTQFWEETPTPRHRTNLTPFRPSSESIGVELKDLQVGVSGKFEFRRDVICAFGCSFDQVCRICSTHPKTESRFLDFTLPGGTSPVSSVYFTLDHEDHQIPVVPKPSYGWSFSSGRLFLDVSLNLRDVVNREYLTVTGLDGNPTNISRGELEEMKTRSGFRLSNGRLLKARIRVTNIVFNDPSL